MGLTLDVAVATHGKEGLKRVEKMLLPPRDGVRYVVSWQAHDNAPIPRPIAERDDVTVCRLDVKGLSNNRNNAISHCKSDIVLIADDDLIYEPDAFQKICQTFENDPGLDLATFRVSLKNAKAYPKDRVRLQIPLPKGYFVTSMEIAFRRSNLSDVKFNALLGLGAPELVCGEEEIFLLDAIKKGLICRHIPIYICSHPTSTTGNNVSPGILMAQGYVIKRYYGATALPRLFLKAYRVSKTGKISLPDALIHLVKGSLKNL